MMDKTSSIQQPKLGLPSTSNLQPVFIAGPTAVGKSAVTLALAEKINGEIISVDSMQVYRGLDVGTAKPTAEERAQVPHHLIDICDLRDAFDAAQFVRLAQGAVAEIQARRRTAIFCGGTGLYFKAFIEGLGEAPPADERLRAELETIPLENLLDELQRRDPETFERIDRKNPRRVIRAVEVIQLTGKKFSEQRAEWGIVTTDAPPRAGLATGSRTSACGSPEPADKNVCPTCGIICLTRQTDDLRHRIDARVEEMFSRGLVEETRRLLGHGLAENQTAMQAIGYRQVVEHLRGERGLAETIELVKTRTRQFAKRQLTWFRRHGNCRWIELKPNETTAETQARISTS